MTHGARFGLAVALAAGLVACQSSDLGQPCPLLLKDPVTGAFTPPFTGSGANITTQEVVGQDSSYPCASMICVATQGRSGYCTQKCLDDAGCPAGFTCRIVQSAGYFANVSVCVWKECDKNSDCGNMQCCAVVPFDHPAKELSLCEASDNGKCL